MCPSSSYPPSSISFHSPQYKQELAKFEQSFKQKEFCELFAEYAAEICNPAARKEQEAYIAQLEKEQKIPEDKELIRPQAGFVVKTHKMKKGAGEQQKDKLFVNIVQSTAMGKPTCERSAQGESWSIPRSIGPVRMEKDKCMYMYLLLEEQLGDIA